MRRGSVHPEVSVEWRRDAMEDEPVRWQGPVPAESRSALRAVADAERVSPLRNVVPHVAGLCALGPWRHIHSPGLPGLANVQRCQRREVRDQGFSRARFSKLSDNVRSGDWRQIRSVHAEVVDDRRIVRPSRLESDGLRKHARTCRRLHDVARRNLIAAPVDNGDVVSGSADCRVRSLLRCAASRGRDDRQCRRGEKKGAESAGTQWHCGRLHSLIITRRERRPNVHDALSPDALASPILPPKGDNVAVTPIASLE
jgi:hypothetical protein